MNDPTNDSMNDSMNDFQPAQGLLASLPLLPSGRVK